MSLSQSQREQRFLAVPQRKSQDGAGGGGTIPRNESVSFFLRDKFAEMNSVPFFNKLIHI